MQLIIFSLSLFGLPLFSNVAHSIVTPSIAPDNVTNRWFHGHPSVYIQQIIMRSMVTPWTEDLVLSDAFRGPLAESFKLVEIIRNYQFEKKISLTDVCLHVENINSDVKILPEYNCLIVSPSNLWYQDPEKFRADSNLIKTIFTFQRPSNVKISIPEIIFGMPLKETGIKRYSVHPRQRVVQFAITIFMKRFVPQYIQGLKNHLKQIYPVDVKQSQTLSETSTFHIYYPGEVNYETIFVLITCYMLLFAYVYYSIQKMDVFVSKVGISCGAVITVVSTLLTTVGLCFIFGLDFTISFQSQMVFPYLVIVVGLENMLIIIKSVGSTAPNLDVKIRLAQGISKEGWAITQNLLIEVTILTGGLLTFVPSIQEFCIFAIVGLLCDYFFQMVFFLSLISLNIKSVEDSTYQKTYYPFSFANFANKMHKSNPPALKHTSRSGVMLKSASHPRLNGLQIMASLEDPHRKPLSKRLRLLYFWASIRIVQRVLMLIMIIWISGIIYNTITIQEFFDLRKSTSSDLPKSEHKSDIHFPLAWEEGRRAVIIENKARVADKKENDIVKEVNYTKENDFPYHIQSLNVEKWPCWPRLSWYNWPFLLGLYNISIAGTYISIPQPILLAHPVTPKEAMKLREPLYETDKSFPSHWKSLAAALDPFDFVDTHIVGPLESRKDINIDKSSEPFIPTSPSELMLITVLCLISILVLVYTLVMLYRCVCSRNYAEWRAGWSHDLNYVQHDSGIQVILEAVPIEFKGHIQSVECIATYGNIIVSTCLGGCVNVWNALTGELISSIDRKNVNDLSDDDEDDIYLLEDTSNEFFDESLSSVSNIQLSESPKNTDQLCSRCKNVILREENYNDLINFDAKISNNILSNKKIEWDVKSKNDSEKDMIDSQIWCVDCNEIVVVLGCADGSLQFWDLYNGLLKCKWLSETKDGFTAIKLINKFVVGVKLSGSLDYFKLDIFCESTLVETSTKLINTSFHRKHIRTGSIGSALKITNSSNDVVRCLHLESIKAHNQPITVLETNGDYIVTGSQDHMLKIFRIEDRQLLYTLHGHYGPITCLFIDQVNPHMAASGSQDGMMCVWDLVTGTCMYTVKSHDGAVLGLTCSASYVLSIGQDDRICVWDRFQGHQLNSIQINNVYCYNLAMLTHNLLITSKQGCIVIMDVQTGEPIKIFNLGDSDCNVVTQMMTLSDSIVCDYGTELRVVRFPMIATKED
ncbi:sterol regulatory element-binding protein cleavage-activating protein isoform X2 [Daktulosphaira vitifoliae]|uniref:sterol regulatory element-binding protein cleavage-activating protein isoform X2 n=1 Tax=Daktulosphaira vitifoliae TaxID=58002 RepID=UPI0021AADB30|nr:sterol regulatory element-binding protein cleavage-activating protein isoform X2 [Daktulosphaira vitifoliae]